MRRNLMRFLIGAMLVVIAPVAVPNMASARTTSSRCPAMTDSIDRLYHAFFDREPDANGFNYWVTNYQTGEDSLEEIAQHFVESDEFQSYKLISNRTYVLWVYRNLLDREPSAEELDHWVRSLAGGYPRGSMMITLTESRDFVTKTETAVPLAGYRRWFPKGTHWYCDTGPKTTVVNDLVGTVWADYYFLNRSDRAEKIALWTRNGDGQRNVTMVAATLQAGFTDYNWDGVFSGNGDYGRQIEVQAGSSTDWIVVFYPHSIGVDRLGWQIS